MKNLKNFLNKTYINNRVKQSSMLCWYAGIVIATAGLVAVSPWLILQVLIVLVATGLITTIQLGITGIDADPELTAKISADLDKLNDAFSGSVNAVKNYSILQLLCSYLATVSYYYLASTCFGAMMSAGLLGGIVLAIAGVIAGIWYVIWAVRFIASCMQITAEALAN